MLVELDGVLESAFEEWRDLKGVCIVRVKWERKREKLGEKLQGFRKLDFRKDQFSFLVQF